MQTLIAALALTIGASAFAQVPLSTVAPKDPTATPKIDQRQVEQQKRIGQGVASGALTSKETTGLQKRETKIQADKVAIKADGKLTKAERRKLNREQNRASFASKRQKSNRHKVAAPVAAK